jgi:hypothetical protein
MKTRSIVFGAVVFALGIVGPAAGTKAQPHPATSQAIRVMTPTGIELNCTPFDPPGKPGAHCLACTSGANFVTLACY